MFQTTWRLPAQSCEIVAHPAVIAFLQGTALVSGAFLSIVLTQKDSRQPWLKLAPQHGVTLALSTILWQLIV